MAMTNAERQRRWRQNHPKAFSVVDTKTLQLFPVTPTVMPTVTADELVPASEYLVHVSDFGDCLLCGCPFCGSKPLVWHLMQQWLLFCSSCDVRFTVSWDRFSGLDGLSRFWNRRHG